MLPFSLDCSFYFASSMFSIMPRIIACFYLSTSGFYIYVIQISSLNITSIIFIILKYLYFFKKIGFCKLPCILLILNILLLIAIFIRLLRLPVPLFMALLSSSMSMSMSMLKLKLMLMFELL